MSKVKARAALFAYFFVSGFLAASLSSRIPFIKSSLKLDDSALGLVLFFLPLGLVVSMPFSGKVLKWMGSRRMLLVWGTVYAFLLILFGYIGQVWQACLLFFLFGICRTFFNIAVNTQGVALQKYYKQSIINLFHGVWSLAGLVGAGAGLLFIAGSVTISWHFIIASGVALSLVFSMYSSSLKFQQKGLVSKTLIWSDKSLWLLGSMSFCSMWCEGAMNDWSSLYMAREGGVDEKWMTAGYVSYLALMVSGRLVGDKLVNLWGVKNLLFYSGILAASGITLAVLWPSFITILIGFSAVGLGVSCVVPMVLLTASQQHPNSAAGAIATISTIGYMGFLSASPVTGFISQHFGLRWAYAICGLLTLALSILVMKRGEGPKVQAAHA